MWKEGKKEIEESCCVFLLNVGNQLKESCCDCDCDSRFESSSSAMNENWWRFLCDLVAFGWWCWLWWWNGRRRERKKKKWEWGKKAGVILAFLSGLMRAGVFLSIRHTFCWLIHPFGQSIVPRNLISDVAVINWDEKLKFKWLNFTGDLK